MVIIQDIYRAGLNNTANSVLLNPEIMIPLIDSHSVALQIVFLHQPITTAFCFAQTWLTISPVECLHWSMGHFSSLIKVTMVCSGVINKQITEITYTVTEQCSSKKHQTNLKHCFHCSIYSTKS